MLWVESSEWVVLHSSVFSVSAFVVFYLSTNIVMNTQFLQKDFSEDFPNEKKGWDWHSDRGTKQDFNLKRSIFLPGFKFQKTVQMPIVIVSLS